MHKKEYAVPENIHVCVGIGDSRGEGWVWVVGGGGGGSLTG